MKGAALTSEKATIAEEYGITINSIDKRLRKMRKGITAKPVGRPLSYDPHFVKNKLLNSNSTRQALRSNRVGKVLQESARNVALNAGKSAHNVSLSTRTIQRAKQLLRDDGASEVTPQLKTEVRDEAEESLRALASLYCISQATMRDVHPELITNTDKTQFHYNIEREKLHKVWLYKGEQKEEESVNKQPPTQAKKQKMRPKATVTGKFNTHLPQRIFATLSCNSLGACSPVVFSKPIADLAKDYIVKIHFRAISIYPGSAPEQQAQLWLYDPAKVSKDQEWEDYYVEIYLPFLRRLYASVFVPPPLTTLP